MHWKKHLPVFILSAIFMASGHSMAESPSKKMPLQVAVISDLDVGNPIRYSPGMMVDYGIRLFNKPKDKARAGSVGNYGILTKDRELYLKPFAGFYKREDYHTALMIGTELTYRATSPSTFFWDVNAGAGYMHLFYNAPVYVYDPKSNSFSEKKFQGYSNVVAKGSINFGLDFSKKEGAIPIGFYLGAGMLFRYPNNTEWVRHPYLQLGSMFTIKKMKK